MYYKGECLKQRPLTTKEKVNMKDMIIDIADDDDSKGNIHLPLGKRC
jgi:hypothetical protein